MRAAPRAVPRRQQRKRRQCRHLTMRALGATPHPPHDWWWRCRSAQRRRSLTESCQSLAARLPRMPWCPHLEAHVQQHAARRRLERQRRRTRTAYRSHPLPSRCTHTQQGCSLGAAILAARASPAITSAARHHQLQGGWPGRAQRAGSARSAFQHSRPVVAPAAAPATSPPPSTICFIRCMRCRKGRPWSLPAAVLPRRLPHWGGLSSCRSSVSAPLPIVTTPLGTRMSPRNLLLRPAHPCASRRHHSLQVSTATEEGGERVRGAATMCRPGAR